MRTTHCRYTSESRDRISYVTLLVSSDAAQVHGNDNGKVAGADLGLGGTSVSINYVCLLSAVMGWLSQLEMRAFQLTPLPLLLQQMTLLSQFTVLLVMSVQEWLPPLLDEARAQQNGLPDWQMFCWFYFCAD
jgi:hypothetical protein